MLLLRVLCDGLQFSSLNNRLTVVNLLDCIRKLQILEIFLHILVFQIKMLIYWCPTSWIYVRLLDIHKMVRTTVGMDFAARSIPKDTCRILYTVVYTLYYARIFWHSSVFTCYRRIEKQVINLKYDHCKVDP